MDITIARKNVITLVLSDDESKALKDFVSQITEDIICQCTEYADYELLVKEFIKELNSKLC